MQNSIIKHLLKEYLLKPLSYGEQWWAVLNLINKVDLHMPHLKQDNTQMILHTLRYLG